MARRSRRQREASARFWKGLFKLCIVAGLIGAIAYYAYAAGQRLATRDVENLRQEISRLTDEASQHIAQTEKLRQDLDQSQKLAADYKERYEDVAPAEVQGVLDAVREKMKQGLSADRLAFVVSQAQEPTGCTQPETRRFLAKTENYDGNNTSIRFNERISVTGRGSAARDGRAQWFDPAAKVELTFSPDGGKDQVISGTLPLKHAMVFKDREYHFTAAAGTRGFIEVTATWCAYGN